ncbi:unnamed protein product [Phytophthora lilii]|uniref:Unnamed protein product n=1 Tax=Phytophthora lilii TaxID=2077276 RepID=A0A9W6TID5_9STRA|nr:unnamed protein product [Phytophthora lilii]
MWFAAVLSVFLAIVVTNTPAVMDDFGFAYIPWFLWLVSCAGAINAAFWGEILKMFFGDEIESTRAGTKCAADSKPCSWRSSTYATKLRGWRSRSLSLLTASTSSSPSFGCKAHLFSSPGVCISLYSAQDPEAACPMAVERRNMTVRLVLLLVGSIASVVAAAESDADLPNWVSPVNASDSACYRKTYLSSDPCATGYGSDGIAACWAQCPLDYPVECGMECIPQSSDCTSEVVDKVASVATVALNAATAGVFGQLSKASKALQLEIDDGSLADALALITEDVAFDGSYGTWSKTGDGTVNIIFESTDSEDVTVVIHSGGDTVAEVDVASGATVSWNSTVISLQDKTLYLDRWRPGLLGVPGSGGGSLLLWVPRSSAGGEIELYAKLNGDGGDSREGNSSSSNVEQDDGNDTNGSQIDSSKDGVATPAPTTFTDENQTDQRPISGEDDDNSTESNATPAPTTSVDESATPAPTSLDDENATPAPSTSDTLKTAQQHQPATIRFHITSHGSSKIKLQVN